MINISSSGIDCLVLLGKRLQAVRLQRNESQQLFAERIGISRQTYSKMERGDPKIPIGCWLQAADLVNRLPEWNLLFAFNDLFAEYEYQQQQQKKSRKRARRKS